MNAHFTPTENRRWMLVDDNPRMLTVLSNLLENLTTAKIECHDLPQSALAAFAGAPKSYELVITDLEMPGLDGVELCRRLRATAPAQKIFLATGSGFFTTDTARHAGFCALRNKPFGLAELSAALAAAGLAGEPARAL